MTESTRWLVEPYDCVILDLDGVVYRGADGVPGATETLRDVRASNVSLVFATNNASRSPAAVAAHLQSLGIPASPDEVLTSAQVAAVEAAKMVPSGAKVLVVGGDGIAVALTERGLVPVMSADDAPVAVVQGFAADIGWRRLAEGAYALARGAAWIATNTDRTIPTSRGVAPGNGTLVDVLAATVGRRPSVVAGKPERLLFDECVRRAGASRPLVVGDRLDTDVEGAVNAGLDSLLVLTGVTAAHDLLDLDTRRRPTFVAEDLTALRAPYERPRRERLNDLDAVTCGAARAWVEGDVVRVDADAGRPIEVLRAVLAVLWHRRVSGLADPTMSSDVLARLP